MHGHVIRAMTLIRAGKIIIPGPVQHLLIQLHRRALVSGQVAYLAQQVARITGQQGRRAARMALQQEGKGGGVELPTLGGARLAKHGFVMR